MISFSLSTEAPAKRGARLLKQFYVMQTEPAKLAEGPELFPRLLALFSAMLPLVRFLNIPLLSWPGEFRKTAINGLPIWR